MAIDGDTIVAGANARRHSCRDDDRASVYTFARTGAATRTQTAKLTATDGAAGDNLGSSVAIDGDTIVAGATKATPAPDAAAGPPTRSRAAARRPHPGRAS